MKIWLDDVREPPDKTWTWCKNSAEFLAAIQYPPQIVHVAFDHDLGEDSMNGSQCASELVRRCLDYNVCPKFSCHSDNFCGRLNILSKMEGLAGHIKNTPLGS